MKKLMKVNYNINNHILFLTSVECLQINYKKNIRIAAYFQPFQQNIQNIKSHCLMAGFSVISSVLMDWSIESPQLPENIENGIL